MTIDLRKLQTSSTEYQKLGKSDTSSSHLGARFQCSLSIDKLRNLKTSIDNALANNFQAQTMDCKLNEDNPAGNCNELFKSIQCGVNELKNKFLRENNNNEEISKLKNACNEIFAKYQKFFDDEIRSITQESSHLIQRLIGNMQRLQSIINTLMDDIKKKTPEILAYKIISGRIPEAVNEFQNAANSVMNYANLMNTVIDKAYGLEYVEKIIKFAYDLTDDEHRKRGFEALYEKMRVHGHLDSPKMIMVYDHVGFIYGAQSLLNKVTPLYDDIINAWSIKMRNNDCEQIVNFAKTYTSSRDYQEKIVKEAYAKHNIENILKCISTLPYLVDVITTLSIMYEEMVIHRHLDTPQLFVLAHKVKSVMDSENFFAISDYYSYKISNLKQSLPEMIRNIIWNGQNCMIKNHDKDEYLYAAGDYHAYDSERRDVFTWISGQTVSQGFWKFESVNAGNDFKIKNTYHNEYLYAAGNYFRFDSERRRIFTWRDGSCVKEGYWKLNPTDSAKYVRIYNNEQREYLYSPNNHFKYDNERRRVFTWMPGYEDGEIYEWEIICN